MCKGGELAPWWTAHPLVSTFCKWKGPACSPDRVFEKTQAVVGISKLSTSFSSFTAFGKTLLRGFYFIKNETITSKLFMWPF